MIDGFELSSFLRKEIINSIFYLFSFPSVSEVPQKGFCSGSTMTKKCILKKIGADRLT